MIAYLTDMTTTRSLSLQQQAVQKYVIEKDVFNNIFLHCLQFIFLKNRPDTQNCIKLLEV